MGQGQARKIGLGRSSLISTDPLQRGPFWAVAIVLRWNVESRRLGNRGPAPPRDDALVSANVGVRGGMPPTAFLFFFARPLQFFRLVPTVLQQPDSSAPLGNLLGCGDAGPVS